MDGMTPSVTSAPQMHVQRKSDEIVPTSFSSFLILLTHERSHREVYRDLQPSLTSSAGGAKGWSDQRFRAPPAFTAQLLSMHQHRANNQYRMANQI